MQQDYPDNFRLDFAVSREQANSKGEKMYIQTRMAEYAEELWELLKKDNTFVYMCGLKGMEKGIDNIMESLAERDGKSLLLSVNVKVLNVYATFLTWRAQIAKYRLFHKCMQGENYAQEHSSNKSQLTLQLKVLDHHFS